MFRTIADFEKAFKTETDFTISIFSALSDESLGQSINNDHRNIGRIAWHICETIAEMMPHTGLEFEALKPPVPTTAAEIVAKYKEISASLIEQIKSKWSDSDLEVEDNLYGEQWQRGSTLLILIKHEIHHRGQLTVLMRQAGVVVPSMYGPAKEGWVAYDMPTPEI